MGADPRPELATNEEWRAIMVRARKAAKLTQKQLGARVGTSQNIISLIESGEIGSSGFILPICEVLDIPAPQHYESEEQRIWAQLGHVLRHKSMKKFRATLELVKAIADADDDVVVETTSEQPPARK